jgi:glucokinase
MNSLLRPSYLLGFDIGGTKCAVVLGQVQDGQARIIDREAFATHTERGPSYALSELESVARRVIERQQLALTAIDCLGIACGGPLDRGRGLILSPPNLPGWDELPISSYFAERLGVPTALQNDANAGALAEWYWGAAQGFQHLVFLTCGTGMGAGLILNGQLYEGANDCAGEVGHVRLAPGGPTGYGKAGSFEGFASGGGIRQLAQRAVAQAWNEGQPVGWCPDAGAFARIDARLVADAARQGDTLAQAVFTTAGTHLGYGLAILIDILNPEAVILGSLYVRCRDLLEPPMRAALDEEALALALQRCTIRPAALSEQIGDYAALAVAYQGVA